MADKIKELARGADNTDPRSELYDAIQKLSTIASYASNPGRNVFTKVELLNDENLEPSLNIIRAAVKSFDTQEIRDIVAENDKENWNPEQDLFDYMLFTDSDAAKQLSADVFGQSGLGVVMSPEHVFRKCSFDSLNEFAPSTFSFFGPEAVITGDDSPDALASSVNFNPCTLENFTNEGAENYLLSLISSAAERGLLRQIPLDNIEGLPPGATIDGLIASGIGGPGSDNAALAAAAAKAGLISDANPFNHTAPLNFKEQCFLLANILTFAGIKQMLSNPSNDMTQTNSLGQRTSPIPENFQKQIPNLKQGAEFNRSLMIHGDPFTLINRLTQSPSKEALFNIRNSALSALQPMIRLYKVDSDADGNEYSTEIVFDSFYNDEMRLGDISSRGFGAGIQSFNFVYDGANPFAVKKSITAKLVIFANSFNELLRPRTGNVILPDGRAPENGPQTIDYRYVDLALKTGSDKAYERVKTHPKHGDVATENFEKLKFRLKAVVGWANPNGIAGSIEGLSNLNAIYDSYVTLNLTPTIHEFDFDELGRVTFTLNYLAYVEDFFDQPMFNIFTEPEATTDQMLRKVAFAALNKKCNANAISEILNSEEIKEKIDEEKTANFQHLLDSMIDANKIRVMDIPMQDLARYQAGGPILDIDDELIKVFLTKNGYPKGNFDTTVRQAFERLNQTRVPDDIEGDTDKPAGAEDPELTDYLKLGNHNAVETVSFFYVSDLVDVILSNIGLSLERFVETLEQKIETLAESVSNKTGMTEEQVAEQLGDEQETYLFLINELRNYKLHLKNYERFRLVLGPLELVKSNVSPAGEPPPDKPYTSALSNLGDIPISVKFFMEFLTNKVLKTDRQEYPLPVFLNDLFNSLVKDFLNNDVCFGNLAQQKTRLTQAALTAFCEYDKGVDPIQRLMQNQENTRLDLTDQNIQIPVLNIMGSRGSPVATGNLQDEINYMVYFAGRTKPFEELRGNRDEDHSKGIFHYALGAENGIVKNVKLERNTSPGLAEVRFEQEGYDGLQQLLVLYNANIKTYMDVTCLPGTYIYVPPESFDPSVDFNLTELGIGGYFMVIRVDHSLGPGLAETNIAAQWVAQTTSTQSTFSSDRTDLCEDIQNERTEALTLEEVINKFKQTAGLGEISEILKEATSAKIKTSSIGQLSCNVGSSDTGEEGEVGDPVPEPAAALADKNPFPNVAATF